MELNVILTSVVIPIIVSAAAGIIIAKINNSAKRKDFRYAKLYDIFNEIQKCQAPPDMQHNNQISHEMKEQYVAYIEFLTGKYELAKPLLSNKITKEIDAEIKRVNLKLGPDPNKAQFDWFKYRIEFRGIISRGIQEQLEKLK